MTELETYLYITLGQISEFLETLPDEISISIAQDFCRVAREEYEKERAKRIEDRTIPAPVGPGGIKHNE